MKLLFDQNLSPRLPRHLGDLYQGSTHIRAIGLRDEDDAKNGNMQSSMVSQLSPKIQIFSLVACYTVAHPNSSRYELEIAPYDQSKTSCGSILPPSTPSEKIPKNRI